VADLLSHAAIAVMLKAGTGWRMPAVFVAGTILPDVASRVPAIGLGYIHVHLVPMPEWLLFAWEPMHQPMGMCILAYLVSMFFGEHIRRPVFWNLLGGMALHLTLDVLQSHHGAGYMLGFPFFTQAFELGWIGSEATVPLAAPLCVFAWWLVRKRMRLDASAQEK
jgi:hypothetical protein